MPRGRWGDVMQLKRPVIVAMLAAVAAGIPALGVKSDGYRNILPVPGHEDALWTAGQESERLDAQRAADAVRQAHNTKVIELVVAGDISLLDAVEALRAANLDVACYWVTLESYYPGLPEREQVARRVIDLVRAELVTDPCLS